jgi:hypothetical protein
MIVFDKESDMSTTYRYAFVVMCLLTMMACGLGAQAIPSTQTSIPPTNTPVFTATIANTDTPLPTNTAEASDTPSPSPVPSATVNPTKAFQDSIMATAMAQIGFISDLNGYQTLYANPVGTPLQNWRDIPVMSEATVGQEFKADIYSYKADATLQQGQKFYNSQATALKWLCTTATGSSGTGSNATHSITMACKGFTVIVSSHDNDTNHILVVLSKPV